MNMKNKGGRPKGSKNQPTLFKTDRRKSATLKLSRESLKVIYEAADRSGLSPQTVLEDVVLAGEFFMRTAYSNLHNLRNRIKEKAKEPNNVVPVRSTEEEARGEAATESGHSGLDREENLSDNVVAVQTNGTRPDDAPSERGHRPEDNPAFGSASELGNVVVIGKLGSSYVNPYDAGTRAYLAQDDPPHYADEGPAPTDEEGNPIEPQEVREEEV